MTAQVATLLAILAAMSVSFFAELLPISFTALMVPVALQATGILKPAQAWAGFANTTIITWYGLFLIGGLWQSYAEGMYLVASSLLIRNVKGILLHCKRCPLAR